MFMWSQLVRSVGFTNGDGERGGGNRMSPPRRSDSTIRKAKFDMRFLLHVLSTARFVEEGTFVRVVSLVR